MARKKQEEKVPDCFARTYGVEILLESKPLIDSNLLLNKLRTRCGNVQLISDKNNLYLFVFNDFIVKYSDGQVPAQLAIIISEKSIDMSKYEQSFYQSWSWNNAKDSVDKAKYSMIITDMMASGLDYKTRLSLFQKSLYCVLETTSCLAIHWYLTQQFINPERFLQNNPDNKNYDLLLGALNVRLFNIEGPEDAVIMDTLGLGALGLPDLQCHFTNLDVNSVASVLYMYGDYIFSNGDVIDDGDTIQGISPDDKWKCRHEISVLEPKRVVIDINTGKGFAVGTRE